jgi:hypothetical protein
MIPDSLRVDLAERLASLDIDGLAALDGLMVNLRGLVDEPVPGLEPVRPGSVRLLNLLVLLAAVEHARRNTPRPTAVTRLLVAVDDALSDLDRDQFEDVVVVLGQLTAPAEVQPVVETLRQIVADRLRETEATARELEQMVRDPAEGFRAPPVYDEPDVIPADDPEFAEEELREEIDSIAEPDDDAPDEPSS